MENRKVRLIDANVFIKDLTAMKSAYDAIALDGMVKALKEAPTIDPESLRPHGHWEWFEEWLPSTTEHPRECEECGWRCGRCKTALEDMVGGYWDDPTEEPKLSYCPNCGAVMQGVKDE